VVSYTTISRTWEIGEAAIPALEEAHDSLVAHLG